MSIELIRNKRDKNSGELYATPPNGKCPIVMFNMNLTEYFKAFCDLL